MHYTLAPSILAADFSDLGNQVRAAEEAGADMLHLDIMDGMFVPSISFGQPVVEALRKKTGLFFDVHLMVEAPERYLEAFCAAGADGITVHAEACRHLHRTTAAIREMGLKAGVALNPSTGLSALEYVLEEVDTVLVMSVNPGFGGQKFIPSALDKIQRLRHIIEERQCTVSLQVDGGISAENAAAVLRAGADSLVAGTAVFGGSIEANIRRFKGVFADVSGGAKDRKAVRNHDKP